jgi:pimeloyl-ACP methyl ester carboxylesterase
MRQMMAVLTQPNRSARLRSVTAPALVIHGVEDRMVHASGGRATAAAIPGAELLLVDGMGHDMPPALYDTFADAIQRTASRATGG